MSMSWASWRMRSEPLRRTAKRPTGSSTRLHQERIRADLRTHAAQGLLAKNVMKTRVLEERLAAARTDATMANIEKRTTTRLARDDEGAVVLDKKTGEPKSVTVTLWRARYYDHCAVAMQS